MREWEKYAALYNLCRLLHNNNNDEPKRFVPEFSKKYYTLKLFFFALETSHLLEGTGESRN